MLAVLQLLYMITWNIKFEILVTWCRNSARRFVNFTAARIPRYSDASITRVNISMTRILAAATRRRFLSTRTPSITRVEQVCAYYWREPYSSHPPRSSHIACLSVVLCVPLAFRRRPRNRFNLPRQEYIDIEKYSSAAKSRVGGWRIRNRGRARQRGTNVRVHREIGQSWWDYFFFYYFPFATCTDFFFLCTSDFFYLG